MNEAVEIIRAYYERLGKIPFPKMLSDHFWLFTNKKENLLKVFGSPNNLMSRGEEKT